jgi:hypothetical protein
MTACGCAVSRLPLLEPRLAIVEPGGELAQMLGKRVGGTEAMA